MMLRDVRSTLSAMLGRKMGSAVHKLDLLFPSARPLGPHWTELWTEHFLAMPKQGLYKGPCLTCAFAQPGVLLCT